MKTKTPQSKTTWERTSVQNLLRNRQSGHYYGRFTITGKQKWYALLTDVLSVAKLRLGADKAEEIEKLRGTTANIDAGDATMHDLIEVFRTRTLTNADIKPATVTARMGSVKRLVKTWPGITLRMMTCPAGSECSGSPRPPSCSRCQSALADL